MTYRAKFGFDWPTFRFRACRGVFLLDQIDPEWAEKVDLRRFTMPIAIHADIPFAIPGEPTWSMRQVQRLIDKVNDPESGCCPRSGSWNVGLACCDPNDCFGVIRAWKRKIAQRQRIARERANRGSEIQTAEGSTT